MVEKQTLKKDESLSNQFIYDWAVKIGKSALERKLPIKLLGATAFINRCPKYRELYFRFGRRLTDVDVMTYGSLKTETVDDFFTGMGFQKQPHYIWHASTRDIFVSGEGLLLDVFRDRLEFCHTILFKDRLDGPWITIPLEEMVLQKLQIVKINDKDLKDLAVLFLEHAVADNSEEGIDEKYIAGLFARDWGFYYSATTNLRKFHGYLKNIPELGPNDKKKIRKEVERLLETIERTPKSFAWKLRAKIGPRMKWYTEVEEIQR